MCGLQQPQGRQFTAAFNDLIITLPADKIHVALYLFDK
jgi:hypothetical protein